MQIVLCNDAVGFALWVSTSFASICKFVSALLMVSVCAFVELSFEWVVTSYWFSH